MTDTRSPEQRRTDELSLAWVESRKRAETVPSTTEDRTAEIVAYQHGYAAGLDGWTSRGTEGGETHEHYCNEAQRAGLGAQWAAGHAEGLKAGGS